MSMRCEGRWPDGARADCGRKKGPVGGPAYRAWVLSPDGYTILPMRPLTTTITIAIFMQVSLDRNFPIVNRADRTFVTVRGAGRTGRFDVTLSIRKIRRRLFLAQAG